MILLIFASLGMLVAATVVLVWWLLGVRRARRDAQPMQVRWVCVYCGAMNLDRLECGYGYAITCPTCYGLNEVVREN